MDVKRHVYLLALPSDVLHTPPRPFSYTHLPAFRGIYSPLPFTFSGMFTFSGISQKEDSRRRKGPENATCTCLGLVTSRENGRGIGYRTWIVIMPDTMRTEVADRLDATCVL